MICHHVLFFSFRNSGRTNASPVTAAWVIPDFTLMSFYKTQQTKSGLSLVQYRMVGFTHKALNLHIHLSIWHQYWYQMELSCYTRITCDHLNKYCKHYPTSLFICCMSIKQKVAWISSRITSARHCQQLNMVKYTAGSAIKICLTGKEYIFLIYVEERSQQYNFFSREIFHLYRHHQTLLYSILCTIQLCTIYYMLMVTASNFVYRVPTNCFLCLAFIDAR